MGPDGTLLPTGERGEVVIQGANVMKGYLNQPEATAETLGDGWLHTGDVGILDADGYLRLVDRIKDMIIRGGENIYPTEIETVLHSHPAVLEAAVVGAPDQVYGEVPVGYVATYPAAAVEIEELLELCRTHLTKIKVPVAIHLVDALPKNPIGKTDKQTLRRGLQDALARPGSREFQEIREGIDAEMGRLPLAEGTEARHVDAGGVPAILCERTGGAHDPFLVYFHGGGYCIASALAYRSFGSHLAKVCRARVLLVDYRLAPEHPFPAAVEDAFAAYRWVLDQGVQPSQVVIGGDSAGGGITAAVLLAARGRSLPLPAGGVCLSPWVDLTNSAASYRTHARSDPSFSKASAENYTAQYLPHGNVTDPLASPVFGDWVGSPSLLVLVSDAEVLHDDATRLADVARAAGAEVEYHEYSSVPHVWPFFYPSWPESQRALEQIAAFVTRVTHP